MTKFAGGVYLGRQAICDRRRRVVAYELLFRSDASGEARFSDGARASAAVIANAFGRFGIRAVVGDCPAFINVDAPTLLSGAIEALPRGRVVIELLESIVVTDEVVRRCRELKSYGYRLALDDFIDYRAEYEPLLELVDVVKIDTLLLDSRALARLVRQLHRWPPKLLAEKVDSRQRAQDCLGLGFRLFQGFFFSRPITLQCA